MGNQTISSPDRTESLLTQLREGDSSVCDDLATIFLEPLSAWLRFKFPRVDPDLCDTAAADTIMAFLNRPEAFDPVLQTLEMYLRFAARKNLYDLLRVERRSMKNGKNGNPIQNFSALGAAEANIICGVRDNPLIELVRIESIEAIRVEFDQVRACLNPPDDKVLDLMIAEKFKTEDFAEVLGVLQVQVDEQRKLVKLSKERVIYRIERHFPHVMEFFRFA